MKGQLTVRGIVIGLIGCVIITAASVYTALKIGALPWPIVFAALVSLFALKALGSNSKNEVNVTHTIMSAGAMVAGGLAFTIPAVWMLDGITFPVWQMILIALAGVMLGLLSTALIRRHFIEKANLEYPIGQAAVQTIVAGDAGGKTGLKLFLSIGLSGIYTVLRDALGVIPAILFGGVSIPRVAFGLYNSPMMAMVGFLVGIGPMIAWFAGAVLASFGLTVAAPALGLWTLSSATGIVSGLGMGIMIGSGIAVILKHIIPGFIKGLKNNGTDGGQKELSRQPKYAKNAIMVGLFVVAIIVMRCLGIGILPCVVVGLLAFVTCAMSAQSVGQTGIDPMEIFGLLVLLFVAALWDMPQVKLLFIAAVVAVACGLAGDVMNDFKAGHELGTSPKAQWLGQAIGAVVGALIAALSMALIVRAYGVSSFGTGQSFVAAQASVIASMLSGVECVPALIIGLVLGIVLYWVGLPATTFGLGIYLPVYLSFTAFLGCLFRLAFNWWGRRKVASSSADAEAVAAAHEETGILIASGILGGESIAGVLIALVSVVIAFV